MFSRIDRLGMAFVFEAAERRGACPDVLVGDGVSMFGCYCYVAVGEEGRCFGGPFLEFLAMRVVLDTADHEVGEMAVFVR